jgi:deoxyribonuclease-4
MKKSSKIGPYLGAHMSIAGGLDKAIQRAAQVGAEALQVFTKNSNQWVGKKITPEDAECFREERQKLGLRYAFAHDSYLINLASPDPTLRSKSIHAFADEIARAEMLGLDYVVFHPGAHLGQGIDEGCRLVAQALNDLLENDANKKVMLLIENAAGQGTTLGSRFEELALIRDKVDHKARVGFCFDTCHAFAAGYDLRSRTGYELCMTQFDRSAGISHIKAFHLNDSKKGLHCRVDRHEHIGQGQLGEATFGFLLNDSRFAHHPMVLETPKSEDLHEDIENLTRLRALL